MPTEKFKPGQSGNPKGKPKGTKSKKTKQWEDLSGHLLGKGADKFITELDKLKGKDYVDAYTKTMEYFKPKLSRTQGMISNLNYDVSKMPKEYLERLYKASTESEMLQIIAEYESITDKGKGGA